MIVVKSITDGYRAGQHDGYFDSWDWNGYNYRVYDRDYFHVLFEESAAFRRGMSHRYYQAMQQPAFILSPPDGMVPNPARFTEPIDLFGDCCTVDCSCCCCKGCGRQHCTIL